jgi:hypothetical protein
LGRTGRTDSFCVAWFNHHAPKVERRESWIESQPFGSFLHRGRITAALASLLAMLTVLINALMRSLLISSRSERVQEQRTFFRCSKHEWRAWREASMGKRFCALFACLIALPLFCQAPSSNPQVATVTAVNAHQSGRENTARQYEVSLKLSDGVYVVLYTPYGGSHRSGIFGRNERHGGSWR